MSAGVLIMARAPRPGEVRRALEPLLGARRCAELQRTLTMSALRWAHDLIPAASIYVAHDPADAGPELRAIAGDGVIIFPQNGDGIAARVADAAARVFAARGGPLLIVWPDLPRLRPLHAAGALDDLGNGADLVLGPVIDGGFYLVGISRPLPGLFSLPESVWRGGDAVMVGLTAAKDAGLEIGILRAERALARPADVRAALADPLTDPGLARTLRVG